MYSFGKKLSNLRKIKGITQGEMATQLDIALRTYQSYERDEREPSFTMVQKIARTLGIRMEQLSEPQGNDDDRLYEAAARIINLFQHDDLSGPAKDAVLMRILEVYWASKAIKKKKRILSCKEKLAYMEDIVNISLSEEEIETDGEDDKDIDDKDIEKLL